MEAHAGANKIVQFLGLSFDTTEIYSYALAVSLLIVAVFAPILSGIADYIGNKRIFMRALNYLGAIGVTSMAFFDPEYLGLGLFIIIISHIGYWGSLVFYNAYLPDIAEPKDHNRISSYGFSLGYVGSSILLVLCIALILMQDTGAEKVQMMALEFPLCAIWWVAFAYPAYKKLPVAKEARKKISSNVAKMGFLELKKVWNEFAGIPRLRKYLYSFFAFSMGVQTVMAVAQFFGLDEIDWVSDDQKTSGMLISILMIQLIAIPGAWGMAIIADRYGNKVSLGVALVIWCVLCGAVYFVHSPTEFYIIAGCVGLVMGGIQSVGRSTYSMYLPKTNDSASYFSFYDALEKIGMVLGLVLFGVIKGSYDTRISLMALSVFFMLGLILLVFVPKKSTVGTK